MHNCPFVCNCVVRHNFNSHSNYSGNYHHYNSRGGGRNYNWKSNSQNRWRWVKDPDDRWNTKSNQSKGANNQRRHSDEPAAKRHAGSGNASYHTTADSAQPSDSLTSKLTERTSSIISDVLSGKSSGNSEKRANTSAGQTDRSSAGNTQNNTPRAGGSGQSQHPERLPTEKPKNTGGGSDANRQKAPTASSRGSTENPVAVGRVQPNKDAETSRPSLLLSPNSAASRTGPDPQASLLRMATKPRSRREELELERMIYEHARKSPATKDRMHDMQLSASGTGTTTATHSSQNMQPAHPASLGRPTAGISGNSADNVIVIGDNSESVVVPSVQDSQPSSSSSVPSTITRPKKSANKSAANKNKTKTARAPKAKVPVTNMELMKRVNSNNARGRGQKRGNPAQRRGNPLPFVGGCGGSRAARSPISSALNLGSLGIQANFVPGFIGSQNMLSPSSSRTMSSLPANASQSPVTEQGPLNTLLQMSLHEENLCGRLSQCSDEIDQLQTAIAKLDEELQIRVRLKETVSFVYFPFSIGAFVVL